ncbi:G-type lectin S-receptor-like serine/threonine-protein kinase LECRK3 [Mercurialis annua]|uniref:G-type lectin S-receptor-like serine/threonine-protein kinase LECRK3 n=1 Tax=Mercurialis annua TaxID=3986 RepID=UPI0021609082|nr:G-type lectin S-receptor-like serine/threonine-protein kinase LECRK3 [Mercurialis annua]
MFPKITSMFLFILLLSCIFSRSSSQHGISNISLGSSLTPANNSYWSSDSGYFAFGFYQKGDGYGIGVWMPNIQEKTLIWTANRHDPPLPANVSLILDGEGRLILRNSPGKQTPIADNPQPASSASMLDSGNFVLYNSKSEILWQTFNDPTDTILPGQRLLAGQQLESTVSNANHMSGTFIIQMRRNGNLVIFSADYPFQSKYFYWKSGTSNAGDNSSLNLDTNGQLYILNTNGNKIWPRNNRRNISGRATYRATIEADGIFRLYSHNLEQNGNWSMEQQFPVNNCDPIGLCGTNAYCILADKVSSCACLPGFNFTDQSKQNLGCQKSSSSDECQERSFTMKELENKEWQTDEPYSTLSASTKQQCAEMCLGDCSCEAAVYSNQKCRKHKLPLRSGKVEENVSGATFIKTSNGSLATKIEANNQKKEAVLITSIVISAFSFSALTICGIAFCRYRIWNYKKIYNQVTDELSEDIVLRSFTYDEMKEATDNFKTEIGRGGFGTVFRGVISNGNIVAIKRLQKVMAEGEREFRNEMNVIARTHHKNLVRLLGYCHDETNMLLVYEYMGNGSLTDFLFESEQKPAWEARVEIALNIARGIVYLHEECQTQIIHCDIKPENILMDEKEWAKIADFGLSKLLMSNQSKTYTGIRGTRGYVAPEWHSNLPITVKVDIYSFGIMLLEIICCRRNVEMDGPDDEVVLANWVYDCFEAKELNKLIRNEEIEEIKLERMVRIALWCIQDEPSMRPSMKKVVLMLEGIIDVPEPPAIPSSSCSV